MEKKKPKKKKNQLPSGNVRVQVYDYTDDNGKKHYKSFTAATKAQAKALANDWKAHKKEHRAENITVSDMVSRYIDLKENVLSPATVRGYRAMLKNRFGGEFGNVRLDDLNNRIIQLWVSDLAVFLSPKSVSNAHGLLSAALDIFYPEYNLKTTLPAKKKPELYCPSDEDVQTLLRHIQGTDLEIAVLLAAFGPLRRGEICALTDKDIRGNCVIVSKSMVQNSYREWIIKQPKTYSSYREVELPSFVIEKMAGRKGSIVRANPEQITNRFVRTLKKTDLPHFRFHDLRHYAASIMHAIGVPDQYILERGGWSSDNVMKSVYRNVISLESKKQNKKINSHFEKLTKSV